VDYDVSCLNVASEDDEKREYWTFMSRTFSTEAVGRNKASLRGLRSAWEVLGEKASERHLNI
jgi:hypothetical protein